MNRTSDISKDFGTLYRAKSALVFYEDTENAKQVYVEHFDMDNNGNPINAHPLTVKEAEVLAKSLQTNKEKNTAFLKSKGVLPTHILHIDPSEKGTVIWFTKAQQRQLYFVESLEIPCGKAQVPAMLWKASKRGVTVFALASNKRTTEKTTLHYAPFFNVFEQGKVCMGTVNIDIKKTASIEEFTTAWETYFFNSYFSHAVGGYNPINGNCINLWKNLIGTENPFPKAVLKKNNQTLKNLL